jgi:transcriptional regulator with XRE-family HTH domain
VDNQLSVGQVLKRRRLRLQLRQEDVGRRAGLSQQAVAETEAASTSSSRHFSRLLPICAALGLRLHDVLVEANVQVDQQNERLRPLQQHLAWRIGHLEAGSGILQGRIVAAEALRKLGRLTEAMAVAERLASDLQSLLALQPHDVEAAALLFEAYDLQAALHIEMAGREAFGPVRALYYRMERLIETSLSFEQSEYRARALFRRADAHLVSNNPRLFAAGLALASGAAAMRDPDRRLNALRVQAALARRVGDIGGFDTTLHAIYATVEQGIVAPATVCVVCQGITGNLASLPQHGKDEAWAAMRLAWLAYDQATAQAGMEDTHLQALLYRSSGHLSALAGSDCDLEQAEASLLGGLELATIAGRQRTAEHCRGSLQQVQQGRPLSELPL